MLKCAGRFSAKLAKLQIEREFYAKKNGQGLRALWGPCLFADDMLPFLLQREIPVGGVHEEGADGGVGGAVATAHWIG